MILPLATLKMGEGCMKIKNGIIIGFIFGLGLSFFISIIFMNVCTGADE